MDTDYAWAAGFFDGEGNVCFSDTDKKRSPRILAQIAQVNRSPLDRFANIVGLGNVTGPYNPKTKNSRPYYRWAIHDYSSVLYLYSKISTWLDEDKTRDFKSAIEKYEEWIKIGLCINGHKMVINDKGKFKCHECYVIGGKKAMEKRWGVRQ